MKPPRLAEWLLTHAVPGPMIDSLAGDLAEEFARRRSALWYWRQVVVAILMGHASEVRQHWVLTIRTIALTWTVNLAAVVLGYRLMASIFVNGRADIQPVVWSQPVLWFLGGAATGFSIALLHRRHCRTMLLTGSVSLLAWAFVSIVLFKRGASQHSFPLIAAAATVYYAIALAGFVVASSLARRAPAKEENA
jgi:hypothetical protein